MVYILISAKLFRSLLVNLKKDRIMPGKEFPSVVYQRVTIISLSCLYPLPVAKHGGLKACLKARHFTTNETAPQKPQNRPTFFILQIKIVSQK